MTLTVAGPATGPADIGRSEEWLGSANVMPDRVLEFASYQAMIACVAAGTGFAVVPGSTLEALRATQGVRRHALPKRFSRNRTHIVWNGEPSLSLRGLLAVLPGPGPS